MVFRKVFRLIKVLFHYQSSVLLFLTVIDLSHSVFSKKWSLIWIIFSCRLLDWFTGNKIQTISLPWQYWSETYNNIKWENVTPLISCSNKIYEKNSAVKMQNLFAFLNKVFTLNQKIRKNNLEQWIMMHQ